MPGLALFSSLPMYCRGRLASPGGLRSLTAASTCLVWPCCAGLVGVAPIEASVLRHCVRLRLPLLREPTIIILTAIETAHPARPPYSVVQACYEPGEDLHLAGLGRAACRFTIRVHVVPSSGDPSLYGQVAVAWAGLPRKPRPLPDSPAARQAMQASYAVRPPASRSTPTPHHPIASPALVVPLTRYRSSLPPLSCCGDYRPHTRSALPASSPACVP